MVKSCTADTLKKPHFALFFMSFFFVSTIKMLLSHSTTKMQHFTHIIHTYNHLESTPFWKFCSQLKEYIYIYPSYNWITSTKLIIIIDSISSFTILPRFFFFFSFVQRSLLYWIIRFLFCFEMRSQSMLWFSVDDSK